MTIAGTHTSLRNAALSDASQSVAPGVLDHIVQFYESDEFLFETVSDFLAEGLVTGQPLIVIATPEHRTGFANALRSKGFDPVAARDNGQLVLLDARGVLGTFMVGAMPDAALFRVSVGGHIEASLKGSASTSVRAYGEMVDLLWRDGNPEAAIRLEELWNDLARTYSFELLCAYPMGNFYRESHGRHFEQICHSHGRVRPAESFARVQDADQMAREISALQQQARALATEIEHRKSIEAALREALQQRRIAEEAVIAAEQELERLLASEQRARAEAERASRMKDEFLAILSHELRTPLSAIIGWVHIVNECKSDEATVRRAFEVIERNASAQLHLIDDLLDTSRIITGKMQMRSERVDLGAVLSAAADTVRPGAVAKSIDIVVDVDDSARFVRGDADRLQQVVWNLLSNAMKFTPRHGLIELRLGRINGVAEISVRDSGAGIAAEFLPFVFERFRQADTTSSRSHGGLGLGLAIVRHLVEAHGGSVAVDSPGEGLGTTFSITLPLYE